MKRLLALALCALAFNLYLLPRINLMLRPRLLTELRPGSRIVSHAFNMGDRSSFVSVRSWPDRMADWLKDSGYLSPRASAAKK